MAASRDRATDDGRYGRSNGDRASFMMDMPDLMNGPQSTDDENEAGGWRGVNAPAGGRMPPPTRSVGQRGGTLRAGVDPD